MSEKRDGIYLSGWEYNRLLQSDPIARRNSALPAEILWNGAAPLWLFRNAFCAQEAIDNEWRAYEILGWPTGRIFTELVNEGVVSPIDWSGLPASTQNLVRAEARLLRSQFDDSRIRELIANGEIGELDTIKNSLIAPIVDHKRCALAVTPNSLRNWITPSGENVPSSSEVVLREIASRGPSGLQLCSPPGTGMPEALRAQAEVQRRYETPMIPDLLAGEGRFEGPTGYEDYLSALEPFRGVFSPINDQLLAEWQLNKRRLFKVREAAQAYLWPLLHDEWLPALEDGEISSKDIIDLLDREFRSRRFSGILTVSGRIAVIVTTAATASIQSAMGLLAALPPGTADKSIIAAGVAAGAGSAAGLASDSLLKKYQEHQDPVRKLTLFHQQMSKAVRPERSKGRPWLNTRSKKS